MKSSDVRVAAFFPEDLDAIEIAHKHAIGDFDMLKTLVDPRFARTGFLEDRIVGAAGVVPMIPGTGLAWLLFSDWVVREKPQGLIIEIMRKLRGGIGEIASAGKFHRIQADVKRDFITGHKFVRVLGFKHEGPMDAYTSTGEDYERYSRVDRSLIDDS